MEKEVPENAFGKTALIRFSIDKIMAKRILKETG